MNGQLNNIRGWLPPTECEAYIASYMANGQYEADVRVASSAARSYLQSIIPIEGVDAVVFDIDKMCRSNLPYYRIHHYGLSMVHRCSTARPKGVAFAAVVFQPLKEIEETDLFQIPQESQESLARLNFTDSCVSAINDQIYVVYNVSYIYHSLFAYFDQDNVALLGE